MSDWSTLQALWALRSDRTLGECDWKVAVALVMFTDAKGQCMPSIRRLAETARTSRSAVQRSLRKLATLDAPIRVSWVERRSHHGDPETMAYTLAPPKEGWPQGAPTLPQPAPTVAPGSTQGGSSVGRGVAPGRATKRISEEDLVEDNEEESRVNAVSDDWATSLYSKISKRKPRGTEKRLKHIRARLRDGYSVEDLATVIKHVAASKFMLGENDSGRPYIEPETIFRSDEKVDQWLASKPRKGHVQTDGTDEKAAEQWGQAGARALGVE